MGSYREVSFEHVSRQGRFLIVYESTGIARLYVYGDPESQSLARTPGQQLVMDLPQHNWAHTVSFSDDLTDEELCTICHRRFLEHDIQYTLVETSGESRLPCVMFDVTMRDLETHRVVLRNDGKGWVMTNIRWSVPVGRFETREVYLARFPHHCFAHTISSSTIAASAASLARLGQSVLSGAEALDYEEIFWQGINRLLPSPYLRTDLGLAGEPLKLARGTLDELTSLIADACRLDDAAWSYHRGQLEFFAQSRTISDPIDVPDEKADNSFFSMRTKDLVMCLLAWFYPEGYEIRPNGASRINWCGYDRIPYLIGGSVLTPTATERLEALDRLISWSQETGVSLEGHLPD